MLLLRVRLEMVVDCEGWMDVWQFLADLAIQLREGCLAVYQEGVGAVA